MGDDLDVSNEVRVWIGTVFRFALSAILLWSGLAKLLESDQQRRDAVAAYRVFPASWVGPLSLGLPLLEVILAVLLLAGLFTRIAALVTALLMLGFIVGIASVWIRGYSIDCGCFGGGGALPTEDGKAWRYTSEILRDLLFVGMATWLVAWPRTKFALDRPSVGSVYDDSDDTDTFEESTR
jgi:uncharacterized membrane protein YphA (DoxX/SURF4 family)